jgi:pimeloyl-ACP methyl ester carboxylesterase
VRRAVLLLSLLVLGCGRQPMGIELAAGGERVRVDCAGTVGPAVVFVHGLGERASAASFTGVRSRLDGDRRTCRYDRPGAGDSPPPTRTGRDAAALDRELAAVVDTADPDRPVVLVGHSFGSYPVLHFAAAHPGRVRAVVTLDGVEPGFGVLRALGDAPPGGEQLDLAAVQAQTARAVRAGLGDLPLLALERDVAGPDWVAAQRRLAALSTAGRVVRVPESGHELPTDDPDAVVAAIRAVTAASR